MAVTLITRILLILFNDIDNILVVLLGYLNLISSLSIK